jgi:hypothetical protein
VKKLVLAIAGSIAASCISLSAHAQSYERFYAGSFDNCTIELNGDSILRGYGVSTSPADWLRSRGYTVDDRAQDGRSTWELVRANNNFDSLAHDSRIVVIQTGINDHRRQYESGWPPVDTVQGVKQDYRYLIRKARELGQIPVVAGIIQLGYPNALGDAGYTTIANIRAAVKQVALEEQAHYASFDAVPLAWTDTIHLNQASSNGVTENIRYVAAHICVLPF